MSSLIISFIDVGWGDSILIEVRDGESRKFALIDSNDSKNIRSSYIYLKRYFEKEKVLITHNFFEFVMLTHAHADHGQGLISILKEYGTKMLYHSEPYEWAGLNLLRRYAKRSNKVQNTQCINSLSLIPNIGDVEFKVLWPKDTYRSSNENNNSVVLLITIKNKKILLTGDMELDIWDQIESSIPGDVCILKIPHHGSINGTFDNHGNTPLLSRMLKSCFLVASTHIKPFGHPDGEVIRIIHDEDRRLLRTDNNHHISVITNGDSLELKFTSKISV